MKPLYRNFSFALIALFVISCSGNKKAESGNQKICCKDSVGSSEALKKIEINKQLNDAALFIAGLPVDSTSEFYSLSQTPQWKKYQKEVNIAWDQFYKVANTIKDWKNKEIPKANDTIQTLFYPFGGPDYLFANIFFPNAKDNILIGLENPGHAPDINTFHKDSLKGMLTLYKTAIEDVIQLSFFRTVDMNVELKTQTIDGTAPLIMLFLARSGKQLVSVTPKNIDETGKLIDAPANAKKTTAIEIAFITPGKNEINHVYYLSTNLADPSLSKELNFMAYLKNIDSASYSFIKSATYLMHKGYFSIIRNTVLNKSRLVLQDASGIAYKYYDKAKWDIKLFGVYEKPIPLFKDFYEADLDEAYKKGASPITFRYGYNRKSSMLLAEKVKR